MKPWQKGRLMSAVVPENRPITYTLDGVNVSKGGMGLAGLLEAIRKERPNNLILKDDAAVLQDTESNNELIRFSESHGCQVWLIDAGLVERLRGVQSWREQ